MPTGKAVREALEAAVAAHAAGHADTLEQAGLTSQYGGVGSGATAEADLDTRGEDDGD